MIRRYPVLREQYEDLHSQSVTASYSSMPHGGGAGRPIEALAIRELPTNSQREYEAVHQAIALTERYPNGRQRLEIIRMVLWDRRYTLEGAALQVPCGVASAKRYHGDFVKLVAKNYGFLD